MNWDTMDGIIEKLDILLDGIELEHDLYRMRDALLIECKRLLQDASEFKFKGEKSISFTVARALALKHGLNSMHGACGAYLDAKIIQLIGKIDQDLAVPVVKKPIAIDFKDDEE